MTKGDLIKAFQDRDINRVLFLTRNLQQHTKVTILSILKGFEMFPKTFNCLVPAIMDGDYYLCKMLIEDGAPLNNEDCLPLCIALKEKQSDIAELLIASGASVNISCEVHNMVNTVYPIYFAIHCHNTPSIIEKIIQAGFDINKSVINNENHKSIHCASSANNIEAAEVLVKYKARLNDIDMQCETAITIAVGKNFLSMVKFLVSKGANLENRKTSICPLFKAIKMEYFKMVELLLDLGVSIHEGWVCNETISPLHFACNYLNIPIIKLLVSRGADVNGLNPSSCETPLHVVCTYVGAKYNGKTLANLQTIVAKILIDQGAKVNVPDDTAKTPLSGAIFSENTELCKLLIREGASVTQKTLNESVGIMIGNDFEYICSVDAFKCPELIKICLEHGSDYNFRDRHGLTPYHCVMAKHNLEMVKIFWRYGCPFDQEEYIPGKMQSILQYYPDEADRKIFEIQSQFIKGVKYNNIKLVVSSLKNGAEPKGCSMDIPSTLHYAAAKGNHKLVQLLLDHGVPVNTVNKKGKTALDIAVEVNNVQTCKVLLQFGASFSYKKIINEKTFKTLTKENKPIQSLFRFIFLLFKLAKQGNGRLLTVLKQFVQAGNLVMLKVLLNCVNRQGLSLTRIALMTNNLQLSRELINLRVNHISC